MPTPDPNPAPKFIGRNIKPGMVPGGFSRKFQGDSRDKATPRQIARDNCEEIKEAANRVLLGVPEVRR